MSTTDRSGTRAAVEPSEDPLRDGDSGPAGSLRPAPTTTQPTLPIYRSGQPVPRDLRTAEDLLANGYPVPTAVAAWLERDLHDSPEARTALYSTASARRNRGDDWLRPGPLVEPGDGKSPRGTGARPVTAGPGHTPLRSNPTRRATANGDPRRWLGELFHEGFIVIDTETTGLSARDEIIELAAVASDGDVLFESRVWPRCGHVPPASTRVHGLTIADLEGAPRWPDVLDELFRAVAGHRILAWNAPFDERLSVQSSRAWGVAHPLPGFECAMRAYAYGRGVGSGSFKLERAATVEGVLVTQQTHRSADDAKRTLAVLKSLHRKSGSRA